ncbi:hypothetical protein LTR27_009444 [Elasticomyces elasticus]|nr:hypothetical protein LTR27_009444 [Elasticomyces elasticus]
MALTGGLTVVALIAPAFIVLLLQARRDPLKAAKSAHWSARYSGLWLWWQHFQDAGTDAVHKAHLRHGPVVRLGPSEISVCAVEGGLDTIYSFRDPMPKTGWYQVANSYGEQPMVALIDEASHRHRRKLLAQPYSKTSMRRNQRWTDAQPRLAHELHSALDKLATSSDTANFFDLAYAWAVDSISDYLFGAEANLHLLADIPRASRTRQAYDAQRAYQFLPLPPVLLNLLGYRPEISWIQGMQRIDNLEASTVFGHVSQSLGTSSNQKAVASAEMQDHMIAGIDTVDLALTACAWQLSLNHAWQHRLHEELQSARCFVLAAELEALPILDAIVKETLRLHVPLTGAQPRITTKSTMLGPPGHEICVPAGVTVHSQAHTLHRSPAFKDAETFDPGRWLESTPEALKEMERWYWPFGSGSRSCVGAQLGTDNFKLAVATLYGSFRTETVEGSTLITSKGVLAVPQGSSQRGLFALHIITPMLQNAVCTPCVMMWTTALHLGIVHSRLSRCQLDLIFFFLSPSSPGRGESRWLYFRLAASIITLPLRPYLRELVSKAECRMAHLISEAVRNLKEPAPHAHPKPSLVRDDEGCGVQRRIFCNVSGVLIEVLETVNRWYYDAVREYISVGVSTGLSTAPAACSLSHFLQYVRTEYGVHEKSS